MTSATASLEVAIALALKLGGDLVHGLAGEGAVDGHQVGHAGLLLAVEADEAVGVGHGALELAHDGVLVVGHQDEALTFVSDLLIFLVGSARDMILAPAAGRSPRAG